MKNILIAVLLLFLALGCSSKSGADLIEAVKANDFETVKKIATEKNVNATDEMNATPAMWAAYVGNVEILDLLVKKGADVKQKGIIGLQTDDEPKTYTNTLIAAAGEGHIDIVKYLVENLGISPDLKGDCLKIFYLLPDQVIKTDGIIDYVKNSKGRVFDFFRQHEYYKDFLISPKKAYSYYLCLIINDLIMQKDLINEVPDIYVFRRVVENRKEVEKIFKAFVSPRNDYSFIKEESCGTALAYASFHNQENVVRYLISKGADVNYKDCNGMFPVIAAAIGKNLNIIKLLLENNADGNVKLKLFDGGNMISIVDYMFQGECNDWKSGEFKNGLRDILSLLWMKDSDIIDLPGPFYETCRCKDSELVKIMMENGADYSKIEHNGKTLKDICKENGVEIKDEWFKKKAE